MEWKSKNQEVRELVARGEYIKALQMCKDWDYADSTYSDILSRGYECFKYPEFYIQIGYNPPEEYEKAVDILIKVYGKAL